MLDNVASFATGSEHNLAVRVDGTVVAWGDNTHGQLGVGVKGTGSLWPAEVRASAAHRSWTT